MGKTKENLAKHKYELPCANCKVLVILSPSQWLKYYESNKLPLCSTNGCIKYKKYLNL